jgi:hypothetical protein
MHNNGKWCHFTCDSQRLTFLSPELVDLHVPVRGLQSRELFPFHLFECSQNHRIQSKVKVVNDVVLGHIECGEQCVF